MAWLLMLVWTYSEAVGWAQWRNGLMITYLSESHMSAFPSTMPGVLLGTMRYSTMGATDRMAAGSGTEAKTS
jgi:hypothetical protein